MTQDKSCSQPPAQEPKSWPCELPSVEVATHTWYRRNPNRVYSVATDNILIIALKTCFLSILLPFALRFWSSSALCPLSCMNSLYELILPAQPWFLIPPLVCLTLIPGSHCLPCPLPFPPISNHCTDTGGGTSKQERTPSLESLCGARTPSFSISFLFHSSCPKLQIYPLMTHLRFLATK